MKNNRIKFTNVDVSKSEAGLKEMVEKSGQNSVPVFEIDEKVFVGFTDTVKKRLINNKWKNVLVVLQR